MTPDQVSILVIDDVNAIRVQVKTMLSQAGFKRTMLATNGEEAKLYLSTQPFHLVLCDWHMEPVTGLDVLRFVRSQPELKQLPFVMVTGETTKERVVQAIQSGIDDYIVKPLTPQIIQTKILDLLMKKKVL